MAKDEKAVALLVAKFSQEEDAREALKELNEAKKRKELDVRDAALLTRDSKNKLHISESADKGFGTGAAIGGVAGAAVGILAGPIGWAALGGAAIGGLATKLHDGGFPDERLRQLGESVTAGSAALVVVIDEPIVAEAQAALDRRGATVTRETVSMDVAADLDREAAKAQGADRN